MQINGKLIASMAAAGALGGIGTSMLVRAGQDDNASSTSKGSSASKLITAASAAGLMVGSHVVMHQAVRSAMASGPSSIPLAMAAITGALLLTAWLGIEQI